MNPPYRLLDDKPRRLVRLGILLMLLATATLTCFLASRQLWARYQRQAARQALEAYRLAEARAYLNQTLTIWPQDVATLLMAGRLARVTEDYDEAETRLREIQKLTGDSETTLLEWALLKAHNGNLDAVEDYLLAQLQEQHLDSNWILEALTAGYSRMYRVTEARRCIELWLEHQPGNAQALWHRGRIWQNFRSYDKAAQDFEQVLQVDEDRDAARLRLAQCLLSQYAPDKAWGHLQKLRKRLPDDEEVAVASAECLKQLEQLDQACALLDSLLEKQPHSIPARLKRGELALKMKQPDKAVLWLEGAVTKRPLDVHANYILLQCYEQLGWRDHAQNQKNKLDQIQKNVERLNDICERDMPKNPQNPALHCELGKWMLQTGQEELGVRWLYSALQKDAQYAPAHAALADYYEHTGDHVRAAHHRQGSLAAVEAAGLAKVGANSAQASKRP